MKNRSTSTHSDIIGQVYEHYSSRIENAVTALGENPDTDMVTMMQAPLTSGYIPACMRYGFELPEATQYPQEIQLQKMEGNTDETEASMIQRLGNNSELRIDCAEFGRPFQIDISVFHPKTGEDGKTLANFKDAFGAGDDIKAIYITVDQNEEDGFSETVAKPIFNGHDKETGEPLTSGPDTVNIPLQIITVILVKQDNQIEETGYLALDGKLLAIIPDSGNGEDRLPMLGKQISEASIVLPSVKEPPLAAFTDEEKENAVKAYTEAVESVFPAIEKKVYDAQVDKLEDRKEIVQDMVEDLRGTYIEAKSAAQLVIARYTEMGMELRGLKADLHAKMEAYETLESGTPDKEKALQEVKDAYQRYEDKKAEFEKELAQDEKDQYITYVKAVDKEYSHMTGLWETVYDDNFEKIDPKGEGTSYPLEFAKHTLKSNEALTVKVPSDRPAAVSDAIKEKAIAYLDQKVTAWNETHEEKPLTLDKETGEVKDQDGNAYLTFRISDYAENKLDGLFDEAEARDFDAEFSEDILTGKKEDDKPDAERPVARDEEKKVTSEETKEEKDSADAKGKAKDRTPQKGRTGVDIVDREGKVKLSAEKRQEIRDDVIAETKIDRAAYDARVEQEKAKIELSKEERESCADGAFRDVVKDQKTTMDYKNIRATVVKDVESKAVRADVYTALGGSVAKADEIKAQYRKEHAPTEDTIQSAENKAKKYGKTDEQRAAFREYFIEQEMDWKAEKAALKEMKISLKDYRQTMEVKQEAYTLSRDDIDSAEKTARELTGIDEDEYQSKVTERTDALLDEKTKLIVDKEFKLEDKIAEREDAVLEKLEEIKTKIIAKLDQRADWEKALLPSFNEHNSYYLKPNHDIIKLTEKYKDAGGEIGEGNCVKDTLSRQEKWNEWGIYARGNLLGTLSSKLFRAFFERVDGVAKGDEPDKKEPEKLTEEDTKDEPKAVDVKEEPSATAETAKEEEKEKETTTDTTTDAEDTKESIEPEEKEEKFEYKHGDKTDTVFRSSGTEQRMDIKFANGRILFDRKTEQGNTIQGEVTVDTDGKRIERWEERVPAGKNGFYFAQGEYKDGVANFTRGKGFITERPDGTVVTEKTFLDQDGAFSNETERTIEHKTAGEDGNVISNSVTVHGLKGEDGKIAADWREEKTVVRDTAGYPLTETTERRYSDGRTMEIRIDNEKQTVSIKETDKDGKTVSYESSPVDVPERNMEKISDDPLYHVDADEDRVMNREEFDNTVKLSTETESTSKQEIVLTKNDDGEIEARLDRTVNEQEEIKEEDGNQITTATETVEEWKYDKENQLEGHTKTITKEITTENEDGDVERTKTTQTTEFDQEGNVIKDTLQEFWDNGQVKEEQIQEGDQLTTRQFDQEGNEISSKIQTETNGFVETIAKEDDAAIVADSEATDVVAEGVIHESEPLVIDDSEEEGTKEQKGILTEDEKKDIKTAISESIDGTVTSTDAVLSDMLDQIFQMKEEVSPTDLFHEVLDVWQEVLQEKTENTPDVLQKLDSMDNLMDTALTLMNYGLESEAGNMLDVADDITSGISAAAGEKTGEQFKDLLYEKYGDQPVPSDVTVEYDGFGETDYQAIQDIPADLESIRNDVIKEMNEPERVEPMQNDLEAADANAELDAMRAKLVDDTLERILDMEPSIPVVDATQMAEQIVADAERKEPEQPMEEIDIPNDNIESAIDEYKEENQMDTGVDMSGDGEQNDKPTTDDGNNMSIDENERWIQESMNKSQTDDSMQDMMSDLFGF